MNDSENNEVTSQYTEQVKSKRPRLILVLFLMILFFSGIAVLSDEWMSNRKIKRIAIYGNEMCSKYEIISLIKDSVLKRKVMNVDYTTLTKLVKANDKVRDVRFSSLFNGEFQVFLTERVPLAIHIDNFGNISYCDETGSLFTYKLTDEYHDLPVIRGVPESIYLVRTANLLNSIKNNANEYLEIISEIMPGRGSNTYEIISSDFGYKLVVDDIAGINEQLAKYFTFLSSSLCANEKIKIDYLDLRWEKRLVIGKAA
ncbi:hypothetical protein MASR1M45_31210 [Candidatus Kapaibacterium sp.]